MKPDQAYRLLTSSSFLLLFLHLLFACSSGSPDGQDTVMDTDSTILKSVNARPLREVKFEITPERIARGKYLTEGPLWCFNCHTERDTLTAGWPPLWDKKGSGALLWKTDSTHLYAPNITPDKKTGIGNFTDDMIVRAVREGVGHDDRALFAMPWFTFRGLTDEDMASVVSYLRTLPAIENKIPQRKLGQKLEEEIKGGGLPLIREIETPDLSDAISRGKYLAGLSDCIGCHSAFQKDAPWAFGGGNPHVLAQNPFAHSKADEIFSSNISSDSTGIGAWPVETFIYVMKNGKGKSGSLNNKMPWTSFKNMTDEDLEAIYQALMTTYPVKHMVQNGVTPTPCEVCGNKHGLGERNKIEPVKPFKTRETPPDDIAGLYAGQVFPDTVKVAVNKNEIVLGMWGREFKVIPISPTGYFAEGISAPLHFVRDERGKVTALEYDDFRKPYKKNATTSTEK